MVRKIVFLITQLIMSMSLSALAFNEERNPVMECTEFSFVLKPSPIGGVGVFTTHDIPAGTRLFSYLYEGHRIRILKIKDVPDEFIKYCIYLNDEECMCPERFDRLEIGWYINHSSAPNIGGRGEVKIHDNIVTSNLCAIKDIKAGEELVMDYNDLNEPEALKEDFYKQDRDSL